MKYTIKSFKGNLYHMNRLFRWILIKLGIIQDMRYQVSSDWLNNHDDEVIKR